MKKAFLGALCALAISSTASFTASAAEFFNTDKSPELFSFGVRMGVNTTNRTIKDAAFPDCYNHEDWGTGFDLGVVANIQFRDYLSLQPGFFFESRSGSYTLLGTRAASKLPDDGSEIAQAGKHNSYNFTIPVMAVIGFNVTDDIRWNVEAGPYVAFVLNSKLRDKHFVVNGPSTEPLFSQKAAPVDFGFKLGSAIELFRHYYFGVHYMAGCVSAWRDLKVDNYTKTFGGCTKGWMFTIGYTL